MSWSSGSWRLVCTTETWKTQAGIRFNNVEVPQGAVITKAYITFRSFNDFNGNASFTIHR